MRLSGGERTGQKLAAPRGKKTRPTSAKVREALFAVLGKRVDGATLGGKDQTQLYVTDEGASAEGWQDGLVWWWTTDAQQQGLPPLRLRLLRSSSKVKRPWPGRTDHQPPKPPKIREMPAKLKARLQRALQVA